MAKSANVNTRVYLDEFNLSGDLNSFNQDVTQETPVVTSFSDTGPRRLVANYDAMIGFLGFGQFADNGMDEQLHLLLADDAAHYIAILPGANAIGSIAYEHVAQFTNMPRSGAIGGAVLHNFDASGRAGMYRGLVLGNKTSTGAESLAGQNMGTTAATQTFAVTFRLMSFTGTSITMVIQESSDDAVGDPYASIAGLTSGALSAAGVVRVTTNAVTEAWKRLQTTGTYSSAVILVTAGVLS